MQLKTCQQLEAVFAEIDSYDMCLPISNRYLNRANQDLLMYGGEPYKKFLIALVTELEKANREFIPPDFGKLIIRSQCSEPALSWNVRKTKIVILAQMSPDLFHAIIDKPFKKRSNKHYRTERLIEEIFYIFPKITHET